MTATPVDNDPGHLTDEQFLEAFLASRLPASGFDHLGHLRAAWLLLQRHPLPVAVCYTCDGIERLARQLGVPDKYHRTLSEALVRLMAHGGAADTAVPWPAFLAANMDLVTDARAVLARYYSDACLQSPAARSRFVFPDRLPLPA